MTAEIICVGTELLLGEVINTNAAYISQKLSELGIFVYKHTVCGDNEERFIACLESAFASNDLVIITGGLGPTYDDMTKEALCKYLGLELVLDKPSLSYIKGFFERMGKKMTDNNIKQAYLPRGAKILFNSCGTAPGAYVEKGEKAVAILPGVPFEMKAMFENELYPILADKSNISLFSENINIFGVGESKIESDLYELMQSSTNPTVAPYAKTGEVRLRITACAKDKKSADALILPIKEKITDMYKDAVYGFGETTLEQELVRLLCEKGKTIATAESCTGGLVSKRITNVSGASQVFGFGVCTYANEAKMKLLGVKEETLKAHGAVSAECALEMAKGALMLSGADIGISTTGIAGPTGGTKEKPVGRVYCGIYAKDYQNVLELTLSRGNRTERETIRLLASGNAIMQAIKYLKK